jgi:D-lactate dehydrogenase
LECARHWRELRVFDNGRRVRTGPGVAAGLVNRYLALHGFKLGPDPASIDACTIGGIVANNSSGMCCGTEQNAYRMLESLQFVLPSGTCVDSAEPDASEQLRAREPVIWTGLARLRDRVRSDHCLVERIGRKYRLKNTMGYALNSFLDFDDPLEILWHLLIGSEGTLAFTVAAVFRNIPELAHKATGLLFFADVPSACAAIAPLRDSKAAALELMDRVALKSVEGKPGVPDFVASLPETASALLVEHQAASPGELAALAVDLENTIGSLPVLRRTPVTRNPAEQAAIWAVRKGIIPSVGAVRRRGTTLVTEDVVFPVEALADGVLGLQDLFRKHAYEDSAVFGHAKDGNLHFLLALGTNSARAVDQFSGFLDDLAELVVRRYGGALKAEHGTGRNMAAYLETEWGRDACTIMREVKALVDPVGILNPGVIFNDNPKIHVADLKSIPKVDEETDRCIECGFCEPKCPSRDLTLTPRQRILIRREEARLRQANRRVEAQALADSSVYEVLDTCATDGLCATACPVAIDTGRMVKKLRGERHNRGGKVAAGWLAKHFAFTETALRGALRAAHAGAAVIGPGALRRITLAASALGAPAWSSDMPRAARRLPLTAREGARALYFPSCITRTFGAPGEPSVAELVVAVSARAGVPVWIPPKIKGTCCGMPFSSKGYGEAHARCVARAVERLWDWSNHGSLPVVIDTSPCAYSLKTGRDALNDANRKKFDALRILDSIEFARESVLPALPRNRQLNSVAVHPVCSVVKMGLSASLCEVAGFGAEECYVPVESGCCGFAGDRGFLRPELTDSAARAEAAELARRSFDGYFASSFTCEIGMSRATGHPWRSFWSLLDSSSR